MSQENATVSDKVDRTMLLGLTGNKDDATNFICDVLRGMFDVLESYRRVLDFLERLSELIEQEDISQCERLVNEAALQMLRVMGKQPGTEKGAKAPKKQRTGNPSPSFFSNVDTATQRAAMDLLQQRMKDGFDTKKSDLLPDTGHDYVLHTRACKKYGCQLCKLERAGTVPQEKIDAARKILFEARRLCEAVDLETAINKLKQMHKLLDVLDKARIVLSKEIEASKKESNARGQTTEDADSRLTAMTTKVVDWEDDVAKTLKGKYVQKKQIGQLIGQRLPTLMDDLESRIDKMLQRPKPELSDISDAEEHDEGVRVAVEEQGGTAAPGSPAGPSTPSAHGEDLTSVKSALPPVALPVDDDRVVTLINGLLPDRTPTSMALDDNEEEGDEEEGDEEEV